MRRHSTPRIRTVLPEIALRGWLDAMWRPAWASLAADCRGVTSLEYAIMGAFIMVAIAASVGGFTGGLGAMMTNTFGSIGASM